MIKPCPGETNPYLFWRFRTVGGPADLQSHQSFRFREPNMIQTSTVHSNPIFRAYSSFHPGWYSQLGRMTQNDYQHQGISLILTKHHQCTHRFEMVWTCLKYHEIPILWVTHMMHLQVCISLSLFLSIYLSIIIIYSMEFCVALYTIYIHLLTGIHTLDKNGSLYDPAGTESCNMQIRSPCW